jgi:hypothetical protein
MQLIAINFSLRSLPSIVDHRWFGGDGIGGQKDNEVIRGAGRHKIGAIIDFRAI